MKIPFTPWAMKNRMLGCRTLKFGKGCRKFSKLVM
jgi:hypothetical protein